MDSTGSVWEKWKPRRKVQAAGIVGALIGLLIAFGPRIGLKFSEDEESALRGALLMLVTTVGTAYMAPGEALAKDEEQEEETASESNL